MAINITKEDIDWVLNRYPNIEYDKSLNSFFGELSFKREYKGIQIADVYNIRVFLNNLDSNTGLPKVICESNKIINIANKYNIDKGDLHINPDGTFCLAIQGEGQNFFKDKFTMQEFFTNAIEGFLFQISHYEKYGNFPWGEYAHGFLGYIEMFAEGSITLQKLLSSLSKKELLMTVSTNRQSKCLCGSNEKLRKCHTKVFKGINKLKQHFSNLYN